MVILSGTNRSGSLTRRVAEAAEAKLVELGVKPVFLDLQDLPAEIFTSGAYLEKPGSFAPFQKIIIEADGLLIVTPEYNGSFPGVLKYFIDMLKFPESLKGLPVGFIGVAAGHYGALRSVEQLTAIVQYRGAHAFGQRIFLHGGGSLSPSGKMLGNDEYQPRFEALIEGFVKFVHGIHA
ncbi:MAG TPA: NAD(P)H-dependent oxidoreductase [Chthoniobacterales bacterium]